jgi:uridine kinase
MTSHTQRKETLLTLHENNPSIERLHQIESRESTLNYQLVNDQVHVKLPNSEEYVMYEKKPSVKGTMILQHPLIQQYVQEQKQSSNDKNELLALRVNQLIVNANNSIDFSQVEVTPVMFYSLKGHMVYRNSLVFLFGMAFKQLYPQYHVTMEHNLQDGYFAEVEELHEISEEMINEITMKMREIVAADLPIIEARVPFDLAVEYFSKSNRPFTSLLIMSNNEHSVLLDACDGYYDLNHGTLVYRTGLIKHFSLRSYQHGILLRFPPDPFGLQFTEHCVLSEQYMVEDSIKNAEPDTKPDVMDAFVAVYRESNEWGKITKLRCVGELNAHIRDNSIKHFIALNHALHDSKIAKIARTIAKNRDIKLVLAAGPSSSGKTTFAKKLSIQMEILGLQPVIISVDDYYKDRSKIPKDQLGSIDFEALDALRLDTLNEHLQALFNGEEIESPIYDFITGAPHKIGRKIKMEKQSVLLMEGIHCLNDALTPTIDSKNKFKVFLAPLTQLNLDELSFIDNTTNRLLRRMVRDYNYRGYSALDTLARWPSVRRAEHRNIFPYIKDANVIVNTALDYEICVLKVYAKPLLKSIQPSNEYYDYARFLLRFLNNFHALGPDYIPSDSLLREFIGGSFFD